LTWGSLKHFIKIKYMTRRPIERNVVCYLSPPHSLHYNNNPPYLCFPFVSKWYAYNRSHIKCGYVFLRLQQEFFALRLSMQPIKFSFHRGCTILHHFLLTFLFLTWVFIFLGAPMGSRSFVKSFVVEALHEDLRTISNLPMFTDL
jgi:hypothetical protein